MNSDPASNPAIPPKRVSAQFMLAHPAHLLAQGFGSGLSPIMPGTMGTLFGWLSFHVMSTRWPVIFSDEHWLLIILGGFVLGCWACAVTGRHLGSPDHGSMVWDEIIAIWLVLAVLGPVSLAAQAGAVVVFRFFDMVKPPPIRSVDQRFKGGFGVMADDIVAALFSLLFIAIYRII